MIWEIIYIIEWGLFLYLGICVAYIATFSIASHYYTQKAVPNINPGKHFLILIPAYKEDKVIHKCVSSVLQQDYPTSLFDIIVISDQMTRETNEILQQKRIHLIKIEVKDSSKAKALQIAIEYIEGKRYDNIIILDADNIIPTNYLYELNKNIKDSIAIQTHRKAQTTITDIALLDSVIEEINNSIFRKGHVCLGLSSALIGSGMVFDYTWFIQNIFQTHSSGEDKELEELLLKQRIRIEYLDRIVLFDEKVPQKEIMKNQRRRWLATQFFLATKMLHYLPTALAQRNKDYILKTIQELILPRSILLGLILFFAFSINIFNAISSIKWWGLLGILIYSLYIAIPNEMRNKALWKAVKQVPFFIFTMVKNLFHLKGIAHKFIHTQHG